MHTLSIEVRSEAHRTSVLCCVCLKSFKAGLCILQDASALIQYDILIFGKTALFPCAVFVISHETLVSLHIAKAY